MKIFKLLLLPYLGVVIAAAFLWPEPAKGFLGESSRIVFFHVPCAWVSTLAFLVAAVYSLAYLRRGNPWHDDVAAAAVRIGLLFGVLTLITGSLFANIMWGTWWNWDPRESSYLLLVFLYAAYLFLRAAVEDPERRPRIAAAYALFAAVLMPSTPRPSSIPRERSSWTPPRGPSFSAPWRVFRAFSSGSCPWTRGRAAWPGPGEMRRAPDVF
jgi:heme exporter protein C